MNCDIIQELERLRQQYDEEGDNGREQAYSRAINSIRKYNKPIRSGREAMELQGIANGIGWRIDQVLGTETVEGKEHSEKPTKKKRPSKKLTLANEEQPPHTPVRVTFCDDDRLQKKIQRPPTQRPPTPSAKGVSREGAHKLLLVIQNIAKGAHVVLADEFRRGRHTLSRLVFLFTEKSLPRSTRRSERDMKHVIETLENAKVFNNISISSNAARIDATAVFRSGKSIKCIMLAIPAVEWPFALIRYTGPSETWKQLQKIAESKGYLLTERSLTYQYTGMTEICRTEKDIFERLDIIFIPPEER